MVKQISSALTPVMRGFAVVWIVGMSAALVIVATKLPNPLPVVGPMVAIVALAAWLFALPLWRAKRVAMTETGLLVGDRAIGFNEIAAVTEFRFASPELVTVRLETGERIRFLATYRVRIADFSLHPIVRELQARIAPVRLPSARAV